MTIALSPIELRGSSPLLEHFAHLTLAPMAAGPLVSVTATPEGGVSVLVELPVLHRDDGLPTWVSKRADVEADRLALGGRLVAESAVRRVLCEALCHEVAECLRGKGGRPVREEHGVGVRPAPRETTERAA